MTGLAFLRQVGFVLLVPLIGISCVPPDPGPAGVEFKQITDGAILSGTYSSPSASWVDVDSDGDEDVYVLNGFGSLEEPPVPQPNDVFLNAGDGTFSRADDHSLVSDVTFSGSSTWADYDNDGDLDVFVANQQNADNHLFRNGGNGSFVRITDGPVVSEGGRSFSASWVDIDNDGRVDLYVANGRSNDPGQEDFVYRNLQDGRFERVDTLGFASQIVPSGGASWGDYDGDGDQDLFLPIDSSAPSRLYRNDGSWSFTDVTSEAGLEATPLPYSPRTSVAHWIDYDNDTDLDLFVGNAPGTLDHLYRNDGTGHFERVHAGQIGLDATYVSDVTWADVDNDADLDLINAVWGGASEFYQQVQIGEFRRSPAGDLSESVHFASSATMSDVDGDGDLDLYLTQWPINEAGGKPNLFFENRTVAGNWLKVDLEGTTSNRAAIGAKIIVSTDTDEGVVTQTRVVGARTSWRGANSLMQHFGVAHSERISRIEVEWPSGHRDTVPGPLAVNRHITIIEGSGIRHESAG